MAGNTTEVAPPAIANVRSRSAAFDQGVTLKMYSP